MTALSLLLLRQASSVYKSIGPQTSRFRALFYPWLIHDSEAPAHSEIVDADIECLSIPPELTTCGTCCRPCVYGCVVPPFSWLRARRLRKRQQKEKTPASFVPVHFIDKVRMLAHPRESSDTYQNAMFDRELMNLNVYSKAADDQAAKVNSGFADTCLACCCRPCQVHLVAASAVPSMFDIRPSASCHDIEFTTPAHFGTAYVHKHDKDPVLTFVERKKTSEALIRHAGSQGARSGCSDGLLAVLLLPCGVKLAPKSAQADMFVIEDMDMLHEIPSVSSTVHYIHWNEHELEQLHPAKKHTDVAKREPETIRQRCLKILDGLLGCCILSLCFCCCRLNLVSALDTAHDMFDIPEFYEKKYTGAVMYVPVDEEDSRLVHENTRHLNRIHSDIIPIADRSRSAEYFEKLRILQYVRVVRKHPTRL